jgi:NADH-quinone oxidoreductase subunit E
MNLKPETLQRIDEVITHYPTKRSATLPLLHLIQEDIGYIPHEAHEWIANKLEIQPINVYDVVTFYPMFRQKPIGRNARVHRNEPKTQRAAQSRTKRTRTKIQPPDR